MTQIFIAIALWCGSARVGGMTEVSAYQVQACRDKMIKCYKDKMGKGIVALLSCFEEQKL